MILLAIDPGEDTGWAIFLHGKLARCGCSRPDEVIPGVSPDRVIIENPQIYPGRTAKAPPKNILSLARKVGRYEERFRAAKITLVSPHDWKGSVDPDVFTNRILSYMDEQEKTILAMAGVTSSKQHNTIDAIGLGKYFLRTYCSNRIA